jgi:hypothetical protein
MKTSSIFGAILFGTALFASSAIAQISGANQSGYQTNERSTTGDSTLGNFNPLNLIHNANLQRSRGPGQFQEDSRIELDRAAEEFKRQQRERLQNPAPIPTTEKP